MSSPEPELACLSVMLEGPSSLKRALAGLPEAGVDIPDPGEASALGNSGLH